MYGISQGVQYSLFGTPGMLQPTHWTFLCSLHHWSVLVLQNFCSLLILCSVFLFYSCSFFAFVDKFRCSKRAVLLDCTWNAHIFMVTSVERVARNLETYGDFNNESRSKRKFGFCGSLVFIKPSIHKKSVCIKFEILWFSVYPTLWT